MACIKYCQLEMFDTEKIPKNEPYDNLEISLYRFPEYLAWGQIKVVPEIDETALSLFSEDLWSGAKKLKFFRENKADLLMEIQTQNNQIASAIKRKSLPEICRILNISRADPNETISTETWYSC